MIANVLTVLLQSPQAHLGLPEPEQGFFASLKNLIAPHYRLQSLTTVIMCLNLIVYAILAAPYPPFLSVPVFARDSLNLLPEHLRHFEFYRLFTCLFVYSDISSLLLGLLILWMFGSFIEETVGMRILFLFNGLNGLIGYGSPASIPTYMIGVMLGISLIQEINPELPLSHRKVSFLVRGIVIIIYVLLFYNQEESFRWSIYMATLTVSVLMQGFLSILILGKSVTPNYAGTTRSILRTMALIFYLSLMTTLLLFLIFADQTFL